MILIRELFVLITVSKNPKLSKSPKMLINIIEKLHKH